MPVAFDLVPAARQLATVVTGVTDDQLDAPTPCPDYTVGDLLDHIVGLSVAFRAAAQKADLPALTEPPPPGSAQRLVPDWHEQLPGWLDELAAAWAEPAAWDGMAQAGGVTMPAEAMAGVALDELVLHGWDLAVSTGQPYDCDPASAQVVLAFTAAMAAPGEQADGNGLFGPPVDVPGDAPPLARALGNAGRDPHWSRPAVG